MTKALEQLGQHGVAYRSPNNDYYQLIKPGRANPSEVQRLIEETSRELQVRALDELNAAPVHQVNHMDANSYNSERGTWRQLTAQFVSPTELPTLSLTLAEQDGLLWYVVSPSKQELMQARSDALQRTRQHDQLVVAVPRRPTDLLKRWKQKQALEILRNNPDYQTSDYQELLDDRGLVGEEYLKAFTQERQWFNKPPNFEWFRAGEPIKVTSTSDLRSLATKIMRDVFPDTPAHKAKQHFNPRKGSRTRVQALEKILQAPFNLPSSGNSTLKFILLNGAGELGLIYQLKSEGGYDDYDLCQPVEPLSLAVWNVLDDDLRQEIPWSEVVAKLKGRPYGLYPSVLQLFSAAFYKFNQDYLEIYKTTRADEQPIDITSKEIIDLIQNPEQYPIRYQPLTDGERQFLAGVEGAWSTPSEQSGGGLRNRVANSLREWINQLPPIARNASADELTTVFSSLPSETIQTCALLLEGANHSSQAQTATILLDKLPTRLGLSADHSQWTETNIKQALEQLERAVLQLENFSTRFKAQLTWQIAQRFGFTERPFNWDEILNAALSWRAEWNVQAEQFPQNSEAKVLISTLDQKPTDFEYVFLKYLPSSWGLKKFERWLKVRTNDDYIKRLEQAKAAVEAKAIEVGARSDQPDTVKSDGATDTSTSKGEEYTVNPSKTVIADPPSPSSDGESTVQQAFTKIKEIFSGLSSQDQEALWERLKSQRSQRPRSSGAQAGKR